VLISPGFGSPVSMGPPSASAQVSPFWAVQRLPLSKYSAHSCWVEGTTWLLLEPTISRSM